MNSIKQTLEAQGVKASIIRRNRKMWKVKEFNGIGNVDYLINNFISENGIEHFNLEGVAVIHGERLSAIIKYWEDTDNDK